MASGSTGNYSIPYPIPTDPVNVTGDIEALATRIDFILQEEIEDTSAAMWTGGTFTNGIQTPIYNDSTGKMSMSLAQDIQTSASPTFVNINLTGNADITGSIINATWDADTISVNKGGTGITSYSAGDIIYASGTDTLSKLSDVATGNALISGGVGEAPLWGKINLTTHISDILPVANGGTGASTSTGSGSVVLEDSPSLLGTPTAPTASASVNNTQIATTAFVQTLVSTLGGLPNQTGNAGKFLTTDGSDASWDNVPSPNNGTLTLNTSGTGLSGSQTFTADQSGNATFTVSINSSTSGSANTIALRNSAGGLTVTSPTAAGSKGVREVTMSTAAPSGGANGDVWLRYS